MAKMIGVLGKKNSRFATSATSSPPTSVSPPPTASVKKGEVVRAVVVRTAAPIRRS
jgi:large subunit ribosomal protein L14